MDNRRGESGYSVLFLESFYGGSHRAFAEGLAAHSSHRIEVRRLPDRNWKWRMHGAALSFAEGIEADHAAGHSWDLIVATSLLDLSDLRARLSQTMQPPPLLFYVHETQFDYPLSPGEVRDAQYGFRNLLSILASDRTLFNSCSHRRRFFREAHRFISRLPKPVPSGMVEEARRRSGVLYPGINVARPPAGSDPLEDTHERQETRAEPPLILWNHRWEHDKDPETFFEALLALDTPNLSWKLAVAGEQYSKAPVVFSTAEKRLAHRIVHFGYCEGREVYESLLRRAHIVVSTARQENFGIAVVEAILAGAIPLLPDRLSYPELLTPDSRSTLLYGTTQELREKLAEAVQNPSIYRQAARSARGRLLRYRWEDHAPRFDRLMERLVGGDDGDPV
jgi:glycosyltransferase involved in cell wall biosynthesis